MKDYISDSKKYVIISTIILIILWKLLSIVIDKSIIVPSPEETFIALIAIISDSTFLLRVYNTTIRIIVGFTISLSLGIILGTLAGFFLPVYYLLKPVIMVLKSVPTMAIILLAIIWLSADKAPILVGGLVIFPVIYIAVVQGVRDIDPKLLEMSKVYKLSRINRGLHLYFPSIQSSLVAIATSMAGLNVKIIIAAEVLSQPNLSVGTSFQMEKATLHTAGVFAWALVAIVMAAVLEWIVKKILSVNYVAVLHLFKRKYIEVFK